VTLFGMKVTDSLLSHGAMNIRHRLYRSFGQESEMITGAESYWSSL